MKVRKFDNCYCFDNFAGSEIKSEKRLEAGNFPVSDNQSIKRNNQVLGSIYFNKPSADVEFYLIAKAPSKVPTRFITRNKKKKVTREIQNLHCS